MINKISLVTCFILFFISCKKQDDQYIVGNPNGPKLKDIIAFTKISADTLEADSASLATIEVKINSEADTNNRDVSFISSGGLFTNSDTMQIVHVNTEGKASVSLLSKRPGTFHIKATVLSYTIDTTITFISSLPDDILLTADRYVADTSATFHITTTLFRNPGRGYVSDPVKVFYNITPLNTSVNLIYPPFIPSENHNTTIDVTNPFKGLGDFKITSKVVSAKGDTLSRSVTIKINK